MPSKQAIRDQIAKVWASDSRTRDNCLAIVDYLCRLRPQARFLTVQTFVEETRIEDAEGLLRAAKFLTGHELPLLEMKFQFVDDDEDEDSASLTEHFSVSEIEKFLRQGRFEHPETGEEIENFEKKLYVFFAPTDFTIENLTKKK